MNAQPAPVFGVSLGDEWLDAALTQRDADLLVGVVIATEMTIPCDSHGIVSRFSTPARLKIERHLLGI